MSKLLAKQPSNYGISSILKLQLVLLYFPCYRDISSLDLSEYQLTAIKLKKLDEISIYKISEPEINEIYYHVKITDKIEKIFCFGRCIRRKIRGEGQVMTLNFRMIIYYYTDNVLLQQEIRIRQIGAYWDLATSLEGSEEEVTYCPAKVIRS